jgi:16S rRNA (cytidine1402-2'-O)-methyltransferase
MDAEDALQPGLYLVATPLGNLGDLSPRAREVLSRALFLAAESSGAAGRWLQILQPPRRPRVLSYREGSRDKDARAILQRLEEGASVALISDAGTPTISDPGWQLVDLARQAGYAVHAVPGPCAAVQALSLAGFPTRRFLFEGFLPAAGRQRREALQRIGTETAPVILYESPHRFLDTLAELAEHLPQRSLFVARELTKKFEESWRGTTSQAVQEWQSKRVQGELTLVLGPMSEAQAPAPTIPAATVELLRSLKLPSKSASAVLKHFFPSASKKELYGLFTDRGADSGPDLA